MSNHQPQDHETTEKIYYSTVSRCRLQDVIKSVTGRTLTDELARLRLLHAEKMLRTTGLKLMAIA